MVIETNGGMEGSTAALRRACADLRGVVYIPDCGHWNTQEKPHETNAALLGFLAATKDLSPGRQLLSRAVAFAVAHVCSFTSACLCHCVVQSQVRRAGSESSDFHAPKWRFRSHSAGHWKFVAELVGSIGQSLERAGANVT